MPLDLALAFSVLLLIVPAVVQAAGQEAVSYLDAAVPAPDNWVKPAPADGSTAATNPPSFRWLREPDAVSYTLQYSRSTEFRGDSTVTVEAIKLNLHHPPKIIKPGKWHWRYRAVFSDGRTSRWSSVRSFTVPKDAVELVLPPIEEVLSRIPKGRPRLFVTPNTLESFREARFGDRKEMWADLERPIGDMVEVPPMEEPAPYADGKWDVEVWRGYLAQARGMGNRIEHLAFGYLITGDRRYADAARAQIMEICTWNPAGTSSFKYNDEVAMPILLSVSRAYDWMYDAFTPEEREKIRGMMRVRGEEVYRLLRSMPYEVKPYASHQTRVLKFLGQASISFLGEIPEAGEWFDWLMSVFYCIYPPWGGTDGSYHEGPSYWSAYFSWAQQFATALNTATGIDLYRKPFFRNTGYWALYCVPPHGAMAPFGDGTSGKPGVGQKLNLYRLSSVYNDPYLRWYADAMPGQLGASLIMYIWQDDSVKAKPPTDLPQSRAFPDCGIVGMHSNLAEGKEDVYLLLKSDPYGSWSHAYADQNSFYLQAFGEPLAISSGYYPWYGSDHHTKWTWQTRAHNSILVNGEGQVPRSMSSQGRIAESLFSAEFDYACGDAVKAYGGRLDKFLRHVLFVRPDYFVMIDELAAKAPSTFDWLLHSLEEMAVDEQGSRVRASKGDARLLVQFVEPEKLALSQTDQFAVPPEKEGLRNQWHLTASTTRPSSKADFVTVLYPYKAGQESALPRIERVEAPGVSGVSVKSAGSEDLVLLNRLDSPMIVDGIRSDARLAALRKSGKRISAVFMTGGKSLSVDRTELVSASTPVSLSMALERGKRSLAVKCGEPTELRLESCEARKGSAVLVKLNGRRLSQPEYVFDHEASTLTLRLGPGEHEIEVQGALP